jgi:hypothetical protein
MYFNPYSFLYLLPHLYPAFLILKNITEDLLDQDADIYRARESIRDNIKISVKENLR